MASQTRLMLNTVGVCTWLYRTDLMEDSRCIADSDSGIERTPYSLPAWCNAAFVRDTGRRQRGAQTDSG